MKDPELLPPAVAHAVSAICEDYDRRQAEIGRGRLSAATLSFYTILNDVIDKALAECCEEGIREVIRHDIGAGVGHRFTQLYFLSCNTYKDRKRKGKLAIAKALHLL